MIYPFLLVFQEQFGCTSDTIVYKLIAASGVVVTLQSSNILERRLKSYGLANESNKILTWFENLFH